MPLTIIIRISKQRITDKEKVFKISQSKVNQQETLGNRIKITPRLSTNGIQPVVLNNNNTKSQKHVKTKGLRIFRRDSQKNIQKM